MKVIKPSVELIWITPNAEKVIESAGRVAYKSEDKITEDSYKEFLRMIIKKGHEAVLEHASVSLKFICDRGVTHELVRHRVASFTQESTRFCNYSKDKFDNELTFIKPCFWENNDELKEFVCYESLGYCKSKIGLWEFSMKWAEDLYLALIDGGATPQEARSVLPNSLKTEIVCTTNMREWKHIFRLRLSPSAHPQMREVMKMAYNILKEQCPIIFEDISI